MDTKKCAALLRALETGSITAAAAELGYTPSGVSRAVASLEEELGVPLLRRSRSGVVPTRECETLLPMLRELLRTAARTEESAARLRGVEIGQITIGTAYSAFYPRLALAAAEAGYACLMIESFDKKGVAEALSLQPNQVPALCMAFGVSAETAVLEDVAKDGSTKYYRDAQGIHHVPKRRLEDVLL